MTQPQFQHDCTKCTFIGTYKHYDLYVCSHSDKRMDTLIARYGDSGDAYVSGLDWPFIYADDPDQFYPLDSYRAALTIAFLRALKQGFTYQK